ncbi:MAG: TonB-dependent receptor [Prevotellaceae bacterium]|jgi:outer membrane receptor protein involved in Fe transport|nr:TonB-dependent receptor [Prevotellaceae bacterium]
MKLLLLTNLLNLFNPLTPPADSAHYLSEVEIVAPIKQQGVFEQSASTSTFTLQTIENKSITSPKDLSLFTPNFYQPDYGSKMTSSLYVRGLGARIDQPAMGLYVDNIPILNKNGYDFDFYDIRKIEVLRGPQGTLYGRNSIGGVINIYTLSPLNFDGTRFSAGYGNENTFDVNLSTYKRVTNKVSMSISVNHKQSDGFFVNEFNGEKADKFLSDGARMRYMHQISEKLLADYIVSFNTVKQDGFAYAYYDAQTNHIQPINHNDPCQYDRTAITNGLTFRYIKPSFIAESTTSFQYINDRMALDQDFLPQSYFTLVQSQNEKAVTQEFVLKQNKPKSAWQWINGIFGFYKHLKMSAPVTFKQTGIEELILKNANKKIQELLYPDGELWFAEDNFTIHSDFLMPNFGLSAYHQSSYSLDNWIFTAGLRFDIEYARIQYKNAALINYYFNEWNMSDSKPINSEMKGKQSVLFPEFLPKFSIMRLFNNGNIYVSLARGYKAGGFNTQIFSDILQSKMQKDLMREFGVSLIGGSSINDIPYKPEYSWNYEIGTTLHLLANKLTANAVAFYVDCTNQQLTVFPTEKNTGRKMSNAGQTRSYGAEISLNYADKKFRLDANYGFTNARFVKFDEGNNDYSGNFVPYAPQNTISLTGEYNLFVNKSYLHKIVLQANWNGAGKIYWNEDNSISQSFYSLLGAQISLVKGNARVSFWGKNILNEKYNTFYFKSIGNSFVQQGKPLQAGVSVLCEF